MDRLFIVAGLIVFALLGCRKEVNTSDSAETAAKKQSIIDTSKIVDIPDDSFAVWHDRVHSRPAAAKGVRMRIRGQIFSDAGGVSNMKMLSRLVARGCSHSVGRIGFLCRGEGVTDLPDSSWVLMTVRVEPESTMLYKDAPSVNAPILDVEKFVFSIGPQNPVLGSSSCGVDH
jgi:uncharacterized membrane protein YcgQ (UPF0703/DUF1980 family)